MMVNVKWFSGIYMFQLVYNWLDLFQGFLPSTPMALWLKCPICVYMSHLRQPPTVRWLDDGLGAWKPPRTGGQRWRLLRPSCCCGWEELRFRSWVMICWLEWRSHQQQNISRTRTTRTTTTTTRTTRTTTTTTTTNNNKQQQTTNNKQQTTNNKQQTTNNKQQTTRGGTKIFF